MPHEPDTPCARCGKLLWSSSTSLPPGQRMCWPCRREQPQVKTYGERICALPECGATFMASHRDQGFCSRTCANHGGRGGTRRPDKVCEVCGQLFKPGDRPGSGYVQRTCGRACGEVLRRTVTMTLATPAPKAERTWMCQDCGVTVTARSLRCPDCRVEYERQYRRELWQREKPQRRWHAGSCGRCGEPFISDRPALFCSDTCARRQARSRRKARRRGVKVEPYQFAVIAARDRYCCGICRKRVAMTKAVPHPRAPTIDHIVPIAEGGDDTAANVRLAHFICNSIRGDRGGYEQLALIG